MATLRSTVILNKLSGKPVDAVRNVWHFSTGGAIIQADIDSVHAGLSAFYQALSGFMARSIPRDPTNLHKIEHAEVTRSGPGGADDTVSSLIGTTSFSTTLAADSGINLPSEAAVVLSIRGDVAGLNEEEAGGMVRPKARRRGRLYLGPWNGSASGEEPLTNRCRVHVLLRTAIKDAYLNQLIGAIDGPARVVNHIVYSPTTSLVHPVVAIHIDDAFDTIRSRGEVALDRTSSDVVQAPLVP
jgi:hypothetical protein